MPEQHRQQFVGLYKGDEAVIKRAVAQKNEMESGCVWSCIWRKLWWVDGSDRRRTLA